MRVEIEISEREAEDLRRIVELRRRPDMSIGINACEMLITKRVADALPRPIQVGDKVRPASALSLNEPFEVVALDDDRAWVKDACGYATFRVDDLAAVESDRNPQ